MGERWKKHNVSHKHTTPYKHTHTHTHTHTHIYSAIGGHITLHDDIIFIVQ